jgi:ribonucleoside-diphosphate reductase alpha chain
MSDDRTEAALRPDAPAASRRQALSNRRPHELVDFQHAGRTYTAGLGRFPDGGLAEIFLNGPKIGADVENAARDSAVVVSIALHALTRNRDGSAAGALGALLDLLAADGC